MTRRTLTVTALAVLGIAATSAVDWPLRFIWNATASAPIGFYTVEPADALDVPELVAVMPPEPLAGFMVERGYIAQGVPLLKRVLGLPGQRVCRAGRTITVDGIEMGEALERDSLGRELPVWQGCRVIGDGQIFLMNWDVRDSLDGRYFGPIPAASVIGRAVPLWTDEEGVGRYEWRAPTH
ncbi:S26 family signal peptidase [Pseudomonas aeruginosa]|uniref:S26 family signal peptidase n=1 Tax=Pseudomonas aeruginosa group TaxID=136841 RepID=UPI0003AC8B26|nr:MULTISPECIES: S26 family signal peptidase [Pseudomonas aeruginosa group]EQL43051.1 peptidase S26 [Pseudomonas aeruginosa VRFPA03]EKS2410137.1 S26 family signal peptidase [Pseudomonas aeruginosa]EKW2501571.1 S26 family signal peptidase [Pseudomonas aeruginosa]EKX4042728.1 S26 family signal peptidase [Pseudomonas aeruginosa]MBS9758843.1 S26 family signal peptidase [Pseudomonas aeruginosa]